MQDGVWQPFTGNAETGKASLWAKYG